MDTDTGHEHDTTWKHGHVISPKTRTQILWARGDFGLVWGEISED